MKDSHDLALLIQSHVPLIRLESHEENRALELLKRVAAKTRRDMHIWTISDGLRFGGLQLEPDPELDSKQKSSAEDPRRVLEQIRKNRTPSIYVLLDYHPYLDNPLHVRLLKDIALNVDRVAHTVILMSHAITLPRELSRYSSYFKLSLPSEQDMRAIVREEAQRYSEKNAGAKIRSDHATLNRMISNLRGLTFDEVRRIVRSLVSDDGAITESELPQVNRAKFELLDMDSILSFEPETERFADVGGLSRLKEWLARRRDAFVAPLVANTVEDRPKGIMLLGIQGSGKSLSAKAVAGLWKLPLLRLDVGAIYNKFIGESERNLRSALELAEVMAPCVLWIDEVEKGFHSGTNDDGVSRRLLGTLLTWMSERKAAVFMVATANDISSLPPELVRKGRFDEIFFVDLPDQAVRRSIFEIHLQRRGHVPAQFALDQLAEASDGFSGAEIEQALVASLYRAAETGDKLADKHLLDEIRQTYPLSVTMAEQIGALREWAKTRAVLA
jgi:SpoVK/Ycf46/Vps4 family AAA+-type ATPase